LKKNKVLLYEILGAVFSVIMSFLLHFIYEWSGGSMFAALIGLVNESVWEHLKILGFAYLFWLIIELPLLNINFRRIITAKAAGLATILISTTFFFYIYSGILGFTVTWINILSAVIWMILGYIVSYKIMNSPADSEGLFSVSLLFIILIVVCFLCFTPNPPMLGIFKDPVTGGYGIQSA